MERINEELNEQNETLHEEHKLIIKENDATINLNNELTAQISKLVNEMESPKSSSKESKKIIELKSTIELDNKTIVQLKTTIEENKKEIQSYEEKLKVMEEQLCISNTMKEEADTHIEKLNKENDKLEKNNEEINLLQQREANNIAQERIDNKKTIKVMERNIECLNNEKIELERKILKMRTEKGQKKMFNIEVQTECTREVFAIKNNEDINMNQRNMDIGKMQGYINTLKNSVRNYKESSEKLLKDVV